MGVEGVMDRGILRGVGPYAHSSTEGSYSPTRTWVLTKGRMPALAAKSCAFLRERSEIAADSESLPW